MDISFTEEMVLNPAALREDGLPEDIRYYREEITPDGWTGYPIEIGSLWLPSSVDICEIEDLINGKLN